MASENLVKEIRALHASNEILELKITQLKANASRLKREIQLLERHFKRFEIPFFERWEADVITRLIEVASIHQSETQHIEAIKQMGNRELLTRAYIMGSKCIHESTVYELGLTDQHYQTLLAYEDVAEYRSDTPEESATCFAMWLADERQLRPAKYRFWSQIYHVCYGQSVDDIADRA
ncbi:Uncharacterized protein PECH_003630 [Penicillium ucsense]|uniref:Uncharacterized protein n=1 Tax=Penicillium ucsense TaxID=2839758 RepID=A0A8J8W0M3_9EURO|nr:Uncharacterized protein PECM_006793 [Penicillium ucsense]KAF7729274.1 Uncharacterized protein PECH_003630 [Penicillium ucsense]